MDPLADLDWTDKLTKSVRPIVTLGMMVVFGVLALTGKISSEAVLGVVGMAFGFWFQSRNPAAPMASMTKTTETDPSGTKREITIKGATP